MRLVAYDSCDDLLGGLRRAAADQVGPYGLGGPVPLAGLPEGDTALNKGAVPAPAPADGGGKAPQHSTTNSHEPGADEPDLVKTDGRRIVTLARGRLQVIDPATRKVAHTLSLAERDGYPGGSFNSQLLLSGERVLILTPQAPMLGRDLPADPRRPGPARPQTRLTLVDLAGAPKVVGTMTSDSMYLDARQSGSVVRVVVRSTPKIDFPPPGRDPEKAVERNRLEVRKAPLDAWLPTFTVGEGKAAKNYRAPCDQVSRPAAYTGAGMVSVLTFDLARGLADPSPVAVATDGATVYGNGSSLYIAGNPPVPARPVKGPAPVEQRTDVHRFDVRNGGRPQYAASGSVPGTLLSQYSLSELQGNLRVVTTTDPGQGTGRPSGSTSQSSMYVLAQNGSRLDQIGRADGLGKGERVYAVRFLGTLAYVVTFKQVDPLYVLDLKDPRRPRVTGELKITGYSAYLHPMADGRLLGIGQDADASGRTKGLQASLFDVSGTPRRVASYKLPGASSQTEFDPHAFLYWPGTGLAVVPVSRPERGASEALALKVTGTGLREAGSVKHPGTDYGNSIRRSVVIGDTLWTFSEDGARATDVATLADRGWLPFTAG
ncbi:beta-propeller domain-containing protein [Actinomadura rubrisoli]|nr:beta-propeller domain-containing protein [Actinomadura rubrisoli]